jgi:hypothetical protein
MKDTTQTFYTPSRFDTLLSSVTETPDLAAALLEALTKHIHFKTNSLKQRIRTFEAKWKMTFEEFKEFSEHARTELLSGSPHLYDVKNDFKVWNQTIMLLKHYESLQTR